MVEQELFTLPVSPVLVGFMLLVVLSDLRYTVSGYPFGTECIFKLFLVNTSDCGLI